MSHNIRERLNSIDSEQFLKMMINIDNSDECWCGSKKEYSECHKKLIGQNEVPIGKINHIFQELKNKKICLHPDKDSCSSEIIKAHSINKSGSLKDISVNGHSYKFEANMENISKWYEYETIIPSRVGINKMSTFLGFCSYHDNKLFAPIDKHVILPTKEQSLLFSIRSIANEIYKKTCVSNLPVIGKELQKGKNSSSQASIEEIMQSHNTGINIALLDMGFHFRNLFSIYDKGQFDRLKRLVIKIDQSPEVLCSGSYFPTVDLFGEELQDLSNDECLENLTFEVFSSKGEGFVHLVWYDNFQSCKKFAESILKMDDIANTVVKLIFGLFENHAFKIPWYDSLSIMKKKGIMKLAMSDFIEYSIYELTEDHKKYVNWNVIDVIQDY